MARRFEFFGSYTSFQGLLDLYPNATLGFSLRKLSVNYNGNCIRVRRSSDNATLDIGFVNNVIDTATLLSFVGAGSGFVTIWYNQATSNNATQTIAVYQPRIVNGGTLETKNGKPSIYFNNNYLELSQNPNLTLTRYLYNYAVANFDVNDLQTRTIVSKNFTNISNSCYSLLKINQQINSFFSGNNGENLISTPIVNTNQKLFTMAIDTLQFNKITNNTVTNTLNTNTGVVNENPVTYKIGCNTSFDLVTPVLFHLGHIHENIGYYNDQLSNDTNIKSNINGYYGIY